MTAWVIKNNDGWTFIEYPYGHSFTKSASSYYQSKADAEFSISVFKLTDCKPVQVEMKEVEESDE